ncbi:MAG: hypothetical protein EZS26_001552 [Candidatus Ordinivivax streblomastigis]|uniref:HTH tetR-type domain-containing protein n=1 Tax=Candidatus Ordinivivax streblomastigis TaxID=2540710 RepID=A0A5M8P1D3_9BACT|nr:MAG: hypothetical protein EZS26_001552 [Candidatus Ordinivivax streblomastigis]
MTMSNIATELGISKRTLYEVFRDKEELLYECISSHMKKSEQEIAARHQKENVIDTLMYIYTKQLRSATEVNSSVYHDLKKYHATIFEKIEARQQEAYQGFAPFLIKGIEQGLIRKEIHVEILVWLLKVQFKALMDDEYVPIDTFSADEFIQAIILNFIRGIATTTGNERVDQLIEKQKNEILK